MATVSWELVRGVIKRESLDRLCVWGPGKTAKYYEAEGVDECVSALDVVEAQVSGDILVEAWKSPGKKGSGYTWSVGAPRGTHSQQMPGPWAELMQSKVELEVLKVRHSLESKDDGFKELAGVMKAYAPAVIASLTGRSLPAAVPTPAAQPVAGADPGSGEAAPGLPAEELRTMLAKVAIFAKSNPDAAREYMKMLDNMTADA